MANNGSKKNGSGQPPEDPGKVLSFPTLAERDRLREQKAAQEKAWRAQYAARNRGASEPFLNLDKIPLIIKITLPLLLAIHVLIYFGMDDAGVLMTRQKFGFVPRYYTQDPNIFMIFGPFTHVFLHGSWTHLGINAMMIAAMGTFFARENTVKYTILFFMSCAVGGAAFHALINPFSGYPLIGASGGISGLFAAFLVAMYRAGSLSRAEIVRRYGITAVFGIWIAVTIGIAIILGGGTHSWEAHTGGLITGLLMMSQKKRGDLRFWRL